MSVPGSEENHEGDRRARVLVSTDWLSSHLGEPGLTVVEVDADTRAYAEGHVPGALAWDWSRDLCDTVQRDIPAVEKMERLLGGSGISPESTILLYGDNNNWFAAWAFWLLAMCGHRDVRLLDGGRRKWLREGRPLSLEVPSPLSVTYRVAGMDRSLRALLPQVLEASRSRSAVLVDTRSPAEYSGDVLSPPGLPETCQRGGHIPGAVLVPWSKTCNEDGTFRSSSELWKLFGDQGITESTAVITYCRIGERSSHTWFVLKYLLGLENVANYDGSWTEWGNLVGAPIERARIGRAPPLPAGARPSPEARA